MTSNLTLQMRKLRPVNCQTTVRLPASWSSRGFVGRIGRELQGSGENEHLVLFVPKI